MEPDGRARTGELHIVADVPCDSICRYTGLDQLRQKVCF